MITKQIINKSKPHLHIMKSTKIEFVALSAVIALCAQSSIGANVIVNGSFENSPAGTTSLSAGSLLLPGWTIVSGAIDTVTGFQTVDGIKCVDLDGFHVTGAISQTVNVQPGQSYLLSFWLASNPDGAGSGEPAVKKMGVTWGGSSLGTFSFDSTGKTEANMGWIQYQVLVSAATSQMTLAFTSQDPVGSAFGPTLDSVSVAIVPEPQLLSLISITACGCFLWRPRK